MCIVVILCIHFLRSADVFRYSAMVFTEHTGLSNLSLMMRYSINDSQCRRLLIAKSFGEEWSPSDCHNACDVCVKLNGVELQDNSSANSGVKYTVYIFTRSDHVMYHVII